MKIIVDTREQAPFTFTGFPSVKTITVGLPTGDYSLVGFEQRIAFERKSIADFVGCLGGGRERFENELHRGRGFDFFGVVIEGSKEAVEQYLLSPVYAGRNRKGQPLTPEMAFNSVRSFEMAYRSHFLFLDNRAACEFEIVDRFRLFLNRRAREAKAIKKHMEAVKNV